MVIVHNNGFRPRVYDESPWYQPIASYLARFDTLGRFPSPDELSALYADHTRHVDLPPLRFVAAPKTKQKRPKKQPIDPRDLYEGRVVERGEVPTRLDDWHDLFNALAFVRFPRAKRALHTRQYRILVSRLLPGATRLPNARTREQDALSLFDEGGICVAAPPERVAALDAADDDTLRRELLAQRIRVLPFGHALYEHMVAGLPVPLGTVYVLPVTEPWSSPHLLDQLDRALALALTDPDLFTLPSTARGAALPSLLADPL
ncbi:MAG: hypothetical protein RLZZ450_5538 [Pseudomonadota bacterium]